MGNPISETVTIGTLGEIFTQLKLLENNIQSCFPLKDSGNDLISTNERCIKLLQIKSTFTNSIKLVKNKIPNIYDLLIFVFFKKQDDGKIDYNNSNLFIYTYEEINNKFKTTKNGSKCFNIKKCKSEKRDLNLNIFLLKEN